MSEKKFEVMAPAGSYESLMAAIKAGCDSVYFGAGKLNMRSASSKNFTLEDLKKIVGICNKNNVKTYLTVNTILYDEDLDKIREICDTAKDAGISAVICSDLAAITYANSIGLRIHASTQLNISNIIEVKFFSKYVDVIVLARELTVEQIKYICDKIDEENICGPGREKLKIEIFVHGALCVAISGKCYMSLTAHNKSANRGECLQKCRRKYRVIEKDTGEELVLENKYVMSPKDLCTIKFLDKILDSGISILKIEGRGRSEDYVYKVTKAYKEAVESIENNTFSKEKIKNWVRELETVYNRGFWHGGYYLGNKLGEWSKSYGSKSKTKRIYVGKATNYYVKPKVGEFLVETSEKISVNDNILITGPTTGVVFAKVGEIKEHPSENGKMEITIPLKEKIRLNDQLYKIVPRDKKR